MGQQPVLPFASSLSHPPSAQGALGEAAPALTVPNPLGALAHPTLLPVHRPPLPHLQERPHPSLNTRIQLQQCSLQAQRFQEPCEVLALPPGTPHWRHLMDMSISGKQLLPETPSRSSS
eukprot:CAMPEP_0178432374 /NCGR_PEP_ID=MMETSP0689_2-20121128/32347_1 /TAXON_ID=160604 /ORGANISM="Amphidinium massartii, Strain CS-259" /LENGTH=118 /DNA_ID=CAMNT_0020054349 /DNA_START=399 /DNA_END=755 /DNA_ORIENTATION=+